MPRNIPIQFRRGTSTEWTNENPVLISGEAGFDVTNDVLKIGDGSTSWTDLPEFAPFNTNLIAGTGIGFVYDGENNTLTINSSGTGGISNLVEDTSPQLGGDLDLNNNDITGTGNVNISGNITANSGILDQIVFNTSLEDPNLIQGQLQWNATEGTLDLGLNESYGMHLGEEMLYRVRNITGNTLLAGQPVYASGLSPGANNRIEVNLYTADGSIREVQFMGLVTEDIPDNGSNGYATHFGYIRRIDTRGDAATYGTTDKLWAAGEPAWNEGDILYVHPTAPGKLTKIEPKHSISVAIITSKGSNGKVFVRPTSYGHLDDNHDVAVSGATNGQFLQYNSETDYWVPSSSGNFTTLQVNGTVVPTGIGTSNYVAKWTGTHSLGTGIIYDNGTNVGIGILIPQAKLDVRGSLYANDVVTLGSGSIPLPRKPIELLNPTNIAELTINESYTFPTSDGSSGQALVTDGSGVVSWTNIALNQTVNGRLTLESGVAISTTDQTAKTTLYFTPHLGNQIALYNGTEWKIYSFSELSLSLSGYTANTNYDVFIYDNSGTLTLESTAWTNNTTRATSLVLQDGVYIKSGASTRRYLGTIRTTATTGQCEDSLSSRFIWNLYNKQSRRLFAHLTANHTYSSSTIRPWNNNTTLGQTRFQFVMGLSDVLVANVIAQGYNNAHVAIGLDATNAFDIVYPFINTDDNIISAGVSDIGLIDTGYHFINAVEWANIGTGSYNYVRLSAYLQA